MSSSIRKQLNERLRIQLTTACHTKVTCLPLTKVLVREVHKHDSIKKLIAENVKRVAYIRLIMPITDLHK